MKELLAAVLDQLSRLQAGFDADILAAHDLGFKEGVASVVIDPLKVFSQADLDKAVADALAALGQLPLPVSDKAFSQADLDKAIADFKAIILAEIQKEEANIEALLK